MRWKASGRIFRFSAKAGQVRANSARRSRREILVLLLQDRDDGSKLANQWDYDRIGATRGLSRARALR